MASTAKWFGDTDPKALEVYVELHRKMTQGERVARVFELCEFQRSLQVANVRAMYPEAGEHEVRCRLAARLFGRDLAMKAYGWDPEVNP